jgi:hypothetical protein
VLPFGTWASTSQAIPLMITRNGERSIGALTGHGSG